MPTNIPMNATQDRPSTACPLCGDTGWKQVGPAEDRRLAKCDCRHAAHTARLLERASIPARYQHCNMANYRVEGPQQGAAVARLAANSFVDQYPLDKTGLLFTGTSGAGKTHLAVAILKRLILEKNVSSLFCDYRELLKQIQNSYNPSVQTTELEILKPVFEAEVLVLDDLGAVKPTAWVWDAVSMVLNTRYNDNRTTIITTNFMDGPAAAASDGGRGAVREETLGDRIGERMRSRVYEMCRIYRVECPDFRKIIRASNR